MPLGQQRRSAVEYLVFGLALALMLVVGYYGIRQGLAAWAARRPAVGVEGAQYRRIDDGAVSAAAPPAVGFVAAIKVIPGGEGKKVVSVPVPARAKSR